MRRTPDYMDKVRRTIETASRYLTPEELEEPQHLIDHNEAPIGLGILGWIIVQNDKMVPASVISGIRELGDGDLPAKLDDHAIPEPSVQHP